MTQKIQDLDVVALLRDVPSRGLVTGQVGTVVEVHDHESFEVEFCDNEGRTYAMVPLKKSDLIVLHYSPVAA